MRPHEYFVTAIIDDQKVLADARREVNDKGKLVLIHFHSALEACAGKRHIGTSDLKEKGDGEV